MRKQLPNYLTILRLILAGVLFVILDQFQYVRGHDQAWILWTALGMFVVAMITDALDGFLARRWSAESTLGRILDPVADKVIVLGALAYLAGPGFIDLGPSPTGDRVAAIALSGQMVSGFYMWMFVVILTRELLVTSIRSAIEGKGIEFGANWAGKWKTIFQSIAIPILIATVALDPNKRGNGWTIYVQAFCAYGMVILTIFSGVPYITGARKALNDPSH